METWNRTHCLVLGESFFLFFFFFQIVDCRIIKLYENFKSKTNHQTLPLPHLHPPWPQSLSSHLTLHKRFSRLVLRRPPGQYKMRFYESLLKSFVSIIGVHYVNMMDMFITWCTSKCWTRLLYYKQQERRIEGFRLDQTGVLIFIISVTISIIMILNGMQFVTKVLKYRSIFWEMSRHPMSYW